MIEGFRLIHGDSADLLPTLEENSVDCCLADPPAGISFMGREWDGDKGGRDAWIDWLSGIMAEVLRVLKPGGHAGVWALPRTSHWTGMALENAGFEVRDVVTHLFGSGFPKSLDVGKAMDRKAGAEREVIGEQRLTGTARQSLSHHGHGAGATNAADPRQFIETVIPLTAPATEEARKWDGFGTALKPAAEFWWLCRKPLSEGSVEANVRRWGCGALHIAAARVGTGQDKGVWPVTDRTNGLLEWGHLRRAETNTQVGRWPPNAALIHSPACRRIAWGQPALLDGESLTPNGHDGTKLQNSRQKRQFGYAGGGEEWECDPACVVAELGRQSGERKAGAPIAGTEPSRPAQEVYAGGWRRSPSDSHDDTGTASRFFPQFGYSEEELYPFRYVAKASRAERDHGLDGFPKRTTDDGRQTPIDNPYLRGETLRRNAHPTVKPLALIKWLVRLACPPGGTVLDPFMGSGTTAAACLEEGFRFIGIEREAEYLEIAKGRLQRQLPLLAGEV